MMYYHKSDGEAYSHLLPQSISGGGSDKSFPAVGISFLQ